ncbi:hypothetical protein [Devosia salina]|uniref:Uncharacterized protein n=1 Tax=Devosia salina TaxID=2860336 RepID=A0ABX8WF96_9HYPH|nr:hypothetical protein [Devosia salina]QYO77443.1 hypothetical protein K1X15_02360 [Devosia salina]
MDSENGARQIAWQLNHDAALRAHARDSDWQKVMLESALKFAEGAIKAITLTTGGAVVVGLAFVGSIYGSEPILAKALVAPVFLLAASAVSGAICAALAYVAQYFYAQASMRKLHKWDHPYVDSTTGAGWRRVVGGIAHVLAVAAAVASFGFIIWGGVLAWGVLAQ